MKFLFSLYSKRNNQKTELKTVKKGFTCTDMAIPRESSFTSAIIWSIGIIAQGISMTIEDLFFALVNI